MKTQQDNRLTDVANHIDVFGWIATQEGDPEIDRWDTPAAFVFFCTGGRLRVVSFRTSLRIFRRSPTRFFYRAFVAVTRTLAKPHLTHCSIGYDGAVLNPRIKGDEFWPMITYVDSCPDLECAVMIPLNNSIDLDAVSILGRRPVLPSLVRRMTLGITPAPRDCVSTVIRSLRAGGVDVPDRIARPGQLYKWLVGQNYDSSLIDPRSS